MNEHSDAAGINASDQYAIARSRHVAVLAAVCAIDAPEAVAIAQRLRWLVARLTDAIADELEPYVPLTWEQLYSSRPER